jgi:predicted ester cyclase
MSPLSLAALAQAVFGLHNTAALTDAYLHRAIATRGGERIFGRDAIVQEALRLMVQHKGMRFGVDADLGDFVAMLWQGDDGRHVRRHEWVTFEGARIGAQTCVDDDRAHPSPPLFHVPLGELQSGKGQVGAGALEGFGAVASALHQVWNARFIGHIDQLYAPDASWQGPDQQGGVSAFKAWLLEQFLAYPQSHVTFERVITQGDQLALLWQWGRIDTKGKRDRVTGSTLVTLADGKIIDESTVVG